MNGWRPIRSFRGPDMREVDLWLAIPASPRSMGMSDAWRAVNCWRRDGKWYDRVNGNEEELFAPYITHWMPITKGPK